MSAALHLLQQVWSKNKTTAYEALNHCMADALNLAIGAKLEWEPKDLGMVESSFRPWYWQGEHGWDRFYALAVWTNATSFIKAFESWTKRKPFIANTVSGRDGSGYVHASSTRRQRGRIALRSEVWIDNVRYECTSIGNERIVLTSRPDEGQKRKILKLTHADCLKRWPAPKKMRPTRAPKGWITRETSLKAGNCKGGTDQFIEGRVRPHLEASGATVGDLSGAAITVRALAEIDPVHARSLARL